MSTIRVTLVKESKWRGGREEWSNSWVLNGEDISGTSARSELILALWDIEKLFINVPSETVLRRAYYYNAIDEPSDEGFTFPAYGQTGAKASTGVGVNTTGGTIMPLENCYLIKSKAGKSTKGKPVYITKYMHGAISTGDPDMAQPASGNGTTALAKLTDGTLPGGLKVCRPNGTVAEGFVLDPLIRSHTLKRRGKRPNSGG